MEPEDGSALPEETCRLFDQAVETYRATALWNMRPARTRSGVMSLARALEKRGDMAAARLAHELRASLDAPRTGEAIC
jgi:hypothetical protein